MKPLAKTNCTWSAELAYVVGLIATDGNLSPDGRHIAFISGEMEMVRLFRKYLNTKAKIGRKSSGYSDKKGFVVQIGDVNFYKFLTGIGLTRNKSRTIGELKIPKEFFYDFFRGCIDGDGSIGGFKHPESKLIQYKIRLVSASKKFLEWIRSVTISDGIKGFLTTSRKMHTLVYAKKDSTKLINLLYYAGFPASLKRKYNSAQIIIGETNK